MSNFYSIMQYVVFALLSPVVLYMLVFATAGLFYRQKKRKPPLKMRKIAVLIPGYKEDAVIVDVATLALKQSYPKCDYDVIVIADSYRQDTLDQLRRLPVRLIEVSFERSTKSKALNRAMAELNAHYDIAVILDADNVMACDFLYKVNQAFEEGCLAVQGHRTAKNLNNSWAILDGISEEISNNIFRKGHRAAGLSSAIIGSGMAFRYDYFKNLMSTVDAVGGFDKEIELKMLKEGVKIGYMDDAYVYDEKVQEAGVFGNQRLRWLSAQLHYLKHGFWDSLKNLLQKGNLDYFDKVIQFLLPPRIFLLVLVFLAGTVFLLTNRVLGMEAMNICWLVLIGANILSMAVSIPGKFYNLSTLVALATLPRAGFVMFKSLFKIKGANEKFIHTRHGSGSLPLTLT